jgi:hypothetical protein
LRFIESVHVNSAFLLRDDFRVSSIALLKFLVLFIKTDEEDVIRGDWVPIVFEGVIPLHDYCPTNILNVDRANCLWTLCSSNGANRTEFPETE